MSFWATNWGIALALFGGMALLMGAIATLMLAVERWTPATRWSGPLCAASFVAAYALSFLDDWLHFPFHTAPWIAGAGFVGLLAYMNFKGGQNRVVSRRDESRLGLKATQGLVGPVFVGALGDFGVRLSVDTGEHGVAVGETVELETAALGLEGASICVRRSLGEYPLKALTLFGLPGPAPEGWPRRWLYLSNPKGTAARLLPRWARLVGECPIDASFTGLDARAGRLVLRWTKDRFSAGDLEALERHARDWMTVV